MLLEILSSLLDKTWKKGIVCAGKREARQALICLALLTWLMSLNAAAALAATPILALVGPGDGATGIFTPPTLEVRVTDADGHPMNVTFYGRLANGDGSGDDFTIIALPDMQNQSQYYPLASNAQTQWIVNNQAAQNIAFVTQLGDLVNNANSHTQYTNADTAIDYLDAGGVFYSVGPGNHDMYIGSPSYFETYFGVSRFTGKSWYRGHYGSNNYNNYSFFSASGMDFILINVQYNPETAMLDWADALLKANPTRRGIVASHSILDIDNSWENQAIYTALRDNPNLFLMLCGHMHTSTDGAAYRAEPGDDGHTIHIMQADYQDYPNGGNGYLRILRFSPLADTIYATTYSPYINSSITTYPDQLNMAYDMFSGSSFTNLGTVINVPSGANAAIDWPGLNNNTSYEWYAVASDGSASATSPVYTFRTADAAYADSANACANHTPCFSSIHDAIDAVSAGGMVTIYSGAYTENIVLDRPVSITAANNANINLAGSYTQNGGTFNATNGVWSIFGNFTYSTGTFNANGGTVVFSGNATRNLTLSAPITFNNLTIGTATTLVETASANHVTVSGALTNNGIIRKSQPVNGSGPLHFGLTGVQMNITTRGALTNLRVERIDQNEPHALNANLQTGRYWNITPTGEGYTANLTLPHNNLIEPKACRYTGAGFDCAADANPGVSSVTRSGITQFSNWTVGNQVGPSAIELRSLSASRLPHFPITLFGSLWLLAVGPFAFQWIWTHKAGN